MIDEAEAFESIFREVMKKAVEAEEREHFRKLREEGIIADMALIINPKHKGVIEHGLFEHGIKRIPVLYSNVVEEDKCYCITDKTIIENIKKNTGFTRVEANDG